MRNDVLMPVCDRSIEQAVSVLREGGLVIGPSRSNYNIMCDPRNERSIERVFQVKKRTKFGPLTLSISSLSGLDTFIHMPENLDKEVLSQVWPSELTLIFRKKYPFPERLTCGAPTVGLTWQGESAMQRLTEAYGHPLAVTSANLSGSGSGLVSLGKALSDLGDQVDLILQEPAEEGAKPAGTEIEGNTIVDLSFNPPVLVRLGIVPLDRIRSRFPGLIEDPAVYPQMLQERRELTEYQKEASHE